MEAAKLVDEKIHGKKVMMFSKSYCPHCASAKKVFEQLIKAGVLTKEEYEVLEIDKLRNGDGIQDRLGKITPGRTVPRVFINGKFVGGASDVVEKHKKGSLQQLLKG